MHNIYFMNNSFPNLITRYAVYHILMYIALYPRPSDPSYFADLQFPVASSDISNGAMQLNDSLNLHIL